MSEFGQPLKLNIRKSEHEPMIDISTILIRRRRVAWLRRLESLPGLIKPRPWRTAFRVPGDGFGAVVAAWVLVLVVTAGALVVLPALHHGSDVSSPLVGLRVIPTGAAPPQHQVTTWREEDDAESPAGFARTHNRDPDEC